MTLFVNKGNEYPVYTYEIILGYASSAINRAARGVNLCMTLCAVFYCVAARKSFGCEPRRSGISISRQQIFLHVS